MNRDEFITLIKEVGSSEDDVKRRDLLSDLETKLTPIFEERDTLKKENTEIKEDNETLRQANMKLFLKVGDSQNKDEIPDVKEETKTRLRYEDLFDEKGMIK